MSDGGRGGPAGPKVAASGKRMSLGKRPPPFQAGFGPSRTRGIRRWRFFQPRSGNRRVLLRELLADEGRSPGRRIGERRAGPRWATRAAECSTRQTSSSLGPSPWPRQDLPERLPSTDAGAGGASLSCRPRSRVPASIRYRPSFLPAVLVSFRHGVPRVRESEAMDFPVERTPTFVPGQSTVRGSSGGDDGRLFHWQGVTAVPPRAVEAGRAAGGLQKPCGGAKPAGPEL